MRLELINCEGAVLKCTIDRFNINLYAYLLDGQGYMRIVPELEELYKYLIGENSFKDVITSSREIKINNVIVDLNDINLNDIHSANKKLIDHPDQNLDQRGIVKMIKIVESRLAKENKLNFGFKSPDFHLNHTYSILKPYVNAIREMSTVKLAAYLNEDEQYKGVSMYLFLARLRDRFENLKKNGVACLHVKIISHKTFPENLMVCRFKGKNSKEFLEVEFQIINKNESVRIINSKNI